MITLSIIVSYLFVFTLGFLAGCVALTKHQANQLKIFTDKL